MYKKMILKDGKYLSSNPHEGGIKFTDITSLELQVVHERNTVYLSSHPTVFKLTKHQFKHLVKNNELNEIDPKELAEIKQMGINTYWKKYSKKFKNIIETSDYAVKVKLC